MFMTAFGVFAGAHSTCIMYEKGAPDTASGRAKTFIMYTRRVWPRGGLGTRAGASSSGAKGGHARERFLCTRRFPRAAHTRSAG